MKLTSLHIANFKAIETMKIDLHPNMNVLVGANGSGKSSVLQALHWMFQSGRNRTVVPRGPGMASTLSEREAIYMPSPHYKSAGHGAVYGNTSGTPQFDLSVTAISDSGEELSASMWLKSARNEGISVHVPSGNRIVSAVRDSDREFSAYIPGVAGIPLVEEKRPKLVVHRSAAAGDANTVLRNMLVLLDETTVNGATGLALVEKYVSMVMGEFRLKVEFRDDRHTSIVAQFQTAEMRRADERSFLPLELAGIGYLQVLQIFAYLVYFRPVLLLVDEPDAHLYPIAQEKLITVLAEAAAFFDSQVLLTTHSPSIVRAVPNDSKVIWMSRGKAEVAGDSRGRTLMGWGLLDKRIVLMTEDAKTGMLRQLLAQWSDLERVVAIWPFHGTGKLPPPETISGLHDLLGGGIKFVIHRDRDFMMPVEVESMSGPYEKHRHAMWFTKYSDVESYWMDHSVVSSHFDIDAEGARDLLAAAVADRSAGGAALEKLRSKRMDALNKYNNKGRLPHFGEADVLAEYATDGEQFTILGKDLLSAIRSEASTRGLAGSQRFGKEVPSNLPGGLAVDLKAILEDALR